MDFHASNPLTPATVADFAEAVTQSSGGHFMARIPESTRQLFAGLFGAPFFAIGTLAPALLESSACHAVIGAAGVRELAWEGGRWLSLHGKTLTGGCKISFTICTVAKPAPHKAPKPLLFQVPQQVVFKPWVREIANRSKPPDVLVLYCPDVFEDAVQMLDDLAIAPTDCVVLLAFRTQLDAIFVRRLLCARGSDVSPIVPFMRSNDAPQGFNRGGWWLRVNTHAPVEPSSLTTELENQLRRCHLAYWQFVPPGAKQEAIANVALTFGTRASVIVEREPIHDAVMAAPDEGFDKRTGRHFQPGNDGPQWSQNKLSETLLHQLPVETGDVTEDRFQLAAWLVDAMGEIGGDESDEFPHEDESDHTERVDQAVNEAHEEASKPVAAEPRVIEPDISEEGGSPRSGKLQVLRSRLSRGAGVVNVLAVAARLGQAAHRDRSFDGAKVIINDWLKSKGFHGVEQAESGHMELPDGEVTIESDGNAIWAMRFDDRQKMEEGAFWRVEVTLLGDETPAIGLRLAQVRRTATAPEPISGVPRVVATLADEIGLHDAGIPLRSKAVSFQGQAGARALINLLLMTGRAHPVIAVSSNKTDKVDASIDRLASRLTGLAHVVCVDDVVSDVMIGYLGRNRAVFGNAIRIYRPEFSLESEPFEHRIWTFAGGQIPFRISNDIAEEVCAISLEVGDLDSRAPPFLTVRNLLSEGRLETLRKKTRKIASTADEERNRQNDMRVELERAIDKYKVQTHELGESVRQLEDELKAALRERNDALDEVRQLKRQLSLQWEPTLIDDSHENIGDDVETYYPDTWDDLETWVETYGDGKLVLLPSAAKAARQSAYEDIKFVYQAMEFLVKYYVPLRTRKPDDHDVRRVYEEATAELGVDVSPVGSAVDEKRYKKEYRRQHNGREIKLDMHVKRGVGFDPKGLFRLYFWYDANATQVVVGHMPTHLTNRITHTG